jgi:hypothetical protein
MILAVRRKLGHLPRLPLVLAEILNGEGFDARNGQHSLPGCVNGKPAEIAGNPASIQFLSNRCCCSAANETVKN